MAKKPEVTVAIIAAASALLVAIVSGLFSLYPKFNPIQVSPPQTINQNVGMGGAAIVGDKNIVNTIQNLTIQNADSPEDRKQKLAQARQLIASEVLANITAIDARLGFAETSLTEDNFGEELRAVRQKVAPAVQEVAASGYRKLLAEQEAASLRQNFNSRPLRSEFGQPMVQLLAQSGSDPETVRAFYDQLPETQWATEALLDTLTLPAEGDAQELDYRKRRVRLALDTLRNRSRLAHVAGLRALNTLAVSAQEVNLKLMTLVRLEPRQLVSQAEFQELWSKLLVEAQKLTGERGLLQDESKRLRGAALEKYRQLDEQLKIKPNDTWSEVVGKAISLRQLGRSTEAIAAFSKYADMFAASDPTATQYARTAQQFTQQLQDLGVDGGSYLYELSNNGAAAQAGLNVGDVLISYGEKVVRNMGDLTAALREAPVGAPIRIVYLRMDAGGRFVRLIGSIVGGPVGAGFMPI